MKGKSREIHADLIQKCKAGNSDAQYKLYKLYVKAMYNICIRMLACKEDAEDVLQDAFIIAFQKIDGFKGESSFGVWLKRIVVNKVLDFLKKRKVEFILFEDQFEFDKEDENIDFSELSSEIIQTEIKNLPRGANLVLNLYLLEGYKHKEIANLLSVSESTSKSQYRRAISMLKEKLSKIMYEEL